MNPLSRRFYKKIKDTDTKLFVFSLLSVFIFEFLFFPAPLLAATEDFEVAKYSSTTKFYLVSQKTIDNKGFFVIMADKDSETILEEDSINEENKIEEQNNFLQKNAEKPKPIQKKATHLTPSPDKKVIESGTSVITAYNSDVAQCDASPCTTANGFNVCKHGIEDTIAANHLPFGTKVKIPELFGDRIFIVRDRMNKRYTNRVDVWMKNKKDALQLGVRTAKVEIVE